MLRWPIGSTSACRTPDPMWSASGGVGGRSIRIGLNVSAPGANDARASGILIGRPPVSKSTQSIRAVAMTAPSAVSTSLERRAHIRRQPVIRVVTVNVSP